MRLIAEAEPAIVDWSKRSKELMQQRKRRKMDELPQPRSKKNKCSISVSSSSSARRELEQFVSKKNFEDSVQQIVSRLPSTAFKRHTEVQVVTFRHMLLNWRLT